MHHLWMKLHAVKLALKIGDRSFRRICSVGQTHEALWQGLHRVAMAHPHGGAVLHVVEQVGGVIHLQRSLAVFRLTGGRLNSTPQLLNHQLHAVTNPQHRDTEIPYRRITNRCMLCVHRARSTTQDDSLRGHPTQLIRRSAVSDHHRKHLGFSDTTGDQFGILRTKVEDDDGRLTLTVGRGLGHRSKKVSRCDKRQSISVKKRSPATGPRQRKWRLRSNKTAPIRIGQSP